MLGFSCTIMGTWTGSFMSVHFWRLYRPQLIPTTARLFPVSRSENFIQLWQQITEGHVSGGPAGLFYGFFVVWLGMISVFTVMSELASLYDNLQRHVIRRYSNADPRAPTSGGQYHWVSMLAPRSCQKFLSYLTGTMFCF